MTTTQKSITMLRITLTAVILTVLLPIVTLTTGLFTVVSATILFVGNCINLPLLYMIGWIRGSK